MRVVKLNIHNKQGQLTNQVTILPSDVYLTWDQSGNCYIKNKYTDKILVEMKNIGLEELKQVQQLLEQE